MELRCAWCGDVIANAGDTAAGLSHGMCRFCAGFFSENRPGDLQSYIERLAIPVLLVDSDGRVQGGNQPAVNALGKRVPEMVGLLGGDVMECAYARLPEGCGNTEHCAACTVRRTVMHTHDTGEACERVVGYQELWDGEHARRTRVEISTRRCCGVVLLKIDKLGD